MKTFLLEARQLTCIRDNRTLFSGLNFQLHGGHILLIEGVNGAGKTSLLRILTGLRQPDEGELFWNTESIENLAASFYQDVAYIGHNNGLKETLTAKENLKYAKALAVRALSIDESLQKVHLDGYQDTLVRYLSAGQQRRLALARLLCTHKTLWILDEPFTSLDKASIQLVEQLITSHVKKGGIVIMTSHHETLFPAELVQKLELRR